MKFLSFASSLWGSRMDHLQRLQRAIEECSGLEREELAGHSYEDCVGLITASLDARRDCRGFWERLYLAFDGSEGSLDDCFPTLEFELFEKVFAPLPEVKTGRYFPHQRRSLKQKIGRYLWNQLVGSFPPLNWLPEYKWAADLPLDVLAGVTTACVGVSQGLAYGTGNI